VGTAYALRLRSVMRARLASVRNARTAKRGKDEPGVYPIEGVAERLREQFG